MSDYCAGVVGRIGLALHRPRIAVEIWRGSTRLRVNPVEESHFGMFNQTISRRVIILTPPEC